MKGIHKRIKRIQTCLVGKELRRFLRHYEESLRRVLNRFHYGWEKFFMNDKIVIVPL